MFLSFLTCYEALQRLDDYLDSELGPVEVQQVQRHLKICRHCTHKFAFEQSFRDQLAAKVRHIQAPPDLIAKVRSALREDCDEEITPPD